MAILYHGRISIVVGDLGASSSDPCQCGSPTRMLQLMSSPGRPWGHAAYLRIVLASRMPMNCHRASAEKVPIGGPDMRDRGGTRSTAQHELVGHKFAVILPERARCCRCTPDRGNSDSGSTPRRPRTFGPVGQRYRSGSGGRDGRFVAQRNSPRSAEASPPPPIRPRWASAHPAQRA